VLCRNIFQDLPSIEQSVPLPLERDKVFVPELFANSRFNFNAHFIVDIDTKLLTDIPMRSAASLTIANGSSGSVPWKRLALDLVMIHSISKY
jgi:hypothetical protein